MMEFFAHHADATAAFALELACKCTLVLLAGFALTLLGHKMSAAWRHWVWCGVFAGLLILPAVMIVAPGWRIVPRLSGGNTKLETPEVKPTLAEGNAKLETRNAKPGVVAVARGMVVDSVPPVASVAPAAVATNRLSVDWRVVGMVAWLAGAAVMFCPLVAALVYLRILERRGKRVEEPEWGLARAMREIGIRRRVVLVESRRAKMPLTFGVVRPTIVVPMESAGWEMRKRRMVLLHELVHIQRLDAATQMMAAVVRTLYWFHPLAWLAYRQMAVERERACDDRVLSGGAEAAAYAETLVDIAAGLRGRTLLIGGIAMARQSTLEMRVRAVLDAGVNRHQMRGAGVMLAAGMLLAVAPLAVLRGADGTPRANATTSADAAGNAAYPVLKFPSGATVELVGIAHEANTGPWWAADGTPVMPKVDLSGPEHSSSFRVGGSGGGRRLSGQSNFDSFLLHFSNLPADAGEIQYDSSKDGNPLEKSGAVRIVGTTGEGAQAVRTDGLVTINLRLPADRRTFLRVGIAEGEWKTLFSGGVGESGKDGDVQYVVGTAMSFNGAGVPVMDIDPATGGPAAGAAPANLSEIRITHSADLSSKDWRIVAIDANGKEHQGQMRVDGTAGNLQTDVADFGDVDAKQVKSVRLEARPIDWVEFKELPVEPGMMEGTVTITGNDITVETKKADGTPDTVLKADKLELTMPAKTQTDTDNAEAKEVYDRLAAQRAKEEGAAADAPGKYYYVMGMVDHAGVYALPASGELTALQAAVAAGVKNENQGLLSVRVMRTGNGKQENVLEIPFSELMKNTDKTVNIASGDVISIGLDKTLVRNAIDELEQSRQGRMNRLTSMKKADPNWATDPEAARLESELTNISARIDALEKLSGQ